MTDPKRWLEDSGELSPEERRVLRAGRRMEPTGAQKRAAWLALAAQMAAQAASQGATAATTATAGAAAAKGAAAATTATAGGAATKGGAAATVVVKWICGGMLLGAVGVGGAKLLEASATQPASAPQTSEPVDAPPASSPSERGHAPSEGASPAGEDPPADSAAEATKATEAIAAEGDLEPPRAKATSPAKSESKPAIPPVQEAPGGVYDEARRVGEARSALRSGDAEGALARLRRLEVDHPHGTLSQEREALTVESLLALGRTEAAQARGSRFLRRFPDSPYVARIRSLIDLNKESPAP